MQGSPNGYGLPRGVPTGVEGMAAVPKPGGSLGSRSSPVSRSLRWAGYLGVLFGLFGVLSGVVGAGTFLPYRNASTFDGSYAGLLTGIAAAGAAVSAVGILAGWELLRARRWAWGAALGVAMTSIALNAAIAGIWPDYLPFAVLVAVVYAVPVLLLLLGAFPARPRLGARPAG